MRLLYPARSVFREPRLSRSGTRGGPTFSGVSFPFDRFADGSGPDVALRVAVGAIGGAVGLTFLGALVAGLVFTDCVGSPTWDPSDHPFCVQEPWKTLRGPLSVWASLVAWLAPWAGAGWGAARRTLVAPALGTLAGGAAYALGKAIVDAQVPVLS